MTDPIARLHARAAKIRARRALFAWELRQAGRAKGAFFRLAAALARAERGFAVDERELRELAREGWPEDPAGRDLEPPREIRLVSAARAARLATARPLSLRMDEALLSERFLVLVPFPPWAVEPRVP